MDLGYVLILLVVLAGVVLVAYLVMDGGHQITALVTRPDEEPEIGNVKPRAREWDQPIQPTDGYEFPDRPTPVTRYEDFNRRLIVYAGEMVELPGGRLPLRAFNDHPCEISCSATSAMAAAEKELRPSFPVIHDCMGLFSSISLRLERDPYYRDAITDSYLAIPEASRPVVISAQKPDDKLKVLTFLRYGFEDFSLPSSFLNPYPEQSLSYIYSQFIGDRELWLWFSPARLRKHVTDEVAHAEFIRQQSLRNQSTQTVRSRLMEVLLTNDYSSLWNLRDTRLSVATSADNDKPDEKATAPQADA